jgi:hypothetical protein
MSEQQTGRTCVNVLTSKCQLATCRLLPAWPGGGWPGLGFSYLTSFIVRRGISPTVTFKTWNKKAWLSLTFMGKIKETMISFYWWRKSKMWGNNSKVSLSRQKKMSAFQAVHCGPKLDINTAATMRLRTRICWHQQWICNNCEWRMSWTGYPTRVSPLVCKSPSNFINAFGCAWMIDVNDSKRKSK